MLCCLDKEKKKYFKVQPNHAAPKGVSYSNDGMRKEKEKDEVSVVRFSRQRKLAICISLRSAF